MVSLDGLNLPQRQPQAARSPSPIAAVASNRVSVVAKDKMGRALLAFLKPKRATDLQQLGQLEAAIHAQMEVEPYDCPDCRDLHVVSVPTVLQNGRQYEAAILCHCQEASGAAMGRSNSLMTWKEASNLGLLEGFKRG